MFMDTLQIPFYEKMVGIVSPSFSDSVIIGEHVEAILKAGKILSTMDNTKNPTPNFPSRK